MGRIISEELYRLKSNGAFYAINALLVVFYAVYFLFIRTMSTQTSTFASTFATFSEYLPVFSAILVIALAQKEYTNHTMKNLVSSGIPRAQIYFGKLISTYIATLIMFILEGIVSVGLFVYQGGTLSLDAFALIKSFGLQLLVCMNYTTVFFLIGYLLKSTGLALAVAYIYQMFGSIVIGIVANFLHISAIEDYVLPVVQSDINVANAAPDAIVRLLVVTLISALCAFIGCFIFTREDIK